MIQDVNWLYLVYVQKISMRSSVRLMYAQRMRCLQSGRLLPILVCTQGFSGNTLNEEIIALRKFLICHAKIRITFIAMISAH